jgi:hypothetical protein
MGAIPGLDDTGLRRPSWGTAVASPAGKRVSKGDGQEGLRQRADDDAGLVQVAVPG